MIWCFPKTRKLAVDVDKGAAGDNSENARDPDTGVVTIDTRSCFELQMIVKDSDGSGRLCKHRNCDFNRRFAQNCVTSCGKQQHRAAV